MMSLGGKSKRFAGRAALVFAGGAIAVLFCVVLAVAIGWHRNYRAALAPGPLVGNKSSSLEGLKGKGLPFSFLVVGDTHNAHRAVALLKKAVKEGPASFMVVLGDFVNQPDVRYRRYFLERMESEIRPAFPVFFVPGNHDIDYTSSKKMADRWRVTPERYDLLYGSRNFDFTFNDCLFIICGIDERDRGRYLSFLQETLSRKAEGRRHIFIFMHQPPGEIGIPDSYPFPNQEEFFTLLETYGVTACFFGDYHGYWRAQRNGTDLIVSGGGGGSLKRYQPEWGKFHHLLRVTVDENGFTEGVMILPGAVIDLRGTLKKWMSIFIFPVIQEQTWILYLGFLLFLSGAIVLLYASLHVLKDRRPRRW